MADTMGSDAPSAEETAPVTDPAGAPEASGEESVEAPQATEPEGPTITVEIDGTEVVLTAEEVQKGYLRQGDYTRKTQEIADQKRRLETLDRFEKSLDADPQLTLSQLAEAYGVELTPAQQQAVQDAGSELDPDDPIQAELAELRKFRTTVEQQFSRQEEAAVQAQIDADLDAVRTEFGAADLDEIALLEFAVERNIPNLKDAYRLQQALESEKAKVDAERKQATKPTVPVEGGGSAPAVSEGGNVKMTLDEAFGAAKRTLGF